MTRRSIQRRLLKARIALNHTIQKILDINRNRKRLEYAKGAGLREEHLSEELRVLNKMAEYQDRLVKHYERSLTMAPLRPTTANQHNRNQQPTPG